MSVIPLPYITQNPYFYFITVLRPVSIHKKALLSKALFASAADRTPLPSQNFNRRAI